MLFPHSQGPMFDLWSGAKILQADQSLWPKTETPRSSRLPGSCTWRSHHLTGLPLALSRHWCWSPLAQRTLPQGTLEHQDGPHLTTLLSAFKTSFWKLSDGLMCLCVNRADAPHDQGLCLPMFPCQHRTPAWSTGSVKDMSVRRQKEKGEGWSLDSEPDFLCSNSAVNQTMREAVCGGRVRVETGAASLREPLRADLP